MAIVEIISYAFIFCLSLIFSILSISRLIENLNKAVILDWLVPILEAFAFVCWLIMVPLHIGFVASAGIFLETPAILYFALGILFLAFTVKSTFDNLHSSMLVKADVSTV